MRLAQATRTEEQKRKFATNLSETKQMPKNELLEVASAIERGCIGKLQNLKASAIIMDT
jgi:hypothetical protein